MKKLIAYAAAALLPSAVLAQTEAKMADGSVYVFTLRNAPSAVAENAPVKQGATVRATGMKIDCAQGQYASLEFSNSVIAVVRENTAFEVEQFSQQQPFKTLHSSERQLELSTLRLKLERGRLDVISKEQRAKSEFSIITRMGVFTFNAQMFSISDDGKKISVAIVEGQAMFKSNRGKTDFVRNKQTGAITKESFETNFPLEISSLGIIEEKNLMRSFDDAKLVRDAVMWHFEGDKIAAKRVIFKEFFQKAPKTNLRK